MGTEGQSAQSNSPEERDAWGLDANGCAPDCPVRLLGEMSGVRDNSYRPHTQHGTGLPMSGNVKIQNSIHKQGHSGYNDTGTAARYFAQFYPHDEPAQETEAMSTQPSESPGETLPINQVLHGDCLEVLRTFEDNSVDSIVTDPPAGISFMLSKDRTWDSDKGGRDMWIAWLTSIMREALRVLKPGGHAFVWALPRTSHWTALALEDAGFEIRDEVSHLFGADSKVQAFMASLNDEQRNAFAQVVDGMSAPSAVLAMFGSGFPKAANVSAMIDKMMGKEREVIGISPNSRFNNNKMYASGNGLRGHENYQGDPITKPATPESEKWQGWMSGLKPSHETWWLVRKPLAEKSIAANVLRYGVGALNIDASRVGTSEINDNTNHSMNGVGFQIRRDGHPPINTDGYMRHNGSGATHTQGRFPSNTLLSHTLLCQPRGEKRVRGHTPGNVAGSAKSPHEVYGTYAHHGSGIHYADSDGMETVAAYDCSEDCPVFLLDQMSGVRKSGGRVHPTNEPFNWHGMKHDSGRAKESSYEPSEGGASRYYQCFPPDDMPPFIYTSKASRAERSKGCEALPETKQHLTTGSGLGNQFRKCPEHGLSQPSGSTSYSCGCRLVFPVGAGETDRASTTHNSHPTVKPVNLLKYLIRMITPPNGIVLDMFAGSGSTGVACVQNGFRYILVEQEQEYIDIIHARLTHAHQAMPVQEQEEGEYVCSEDCPVRALEMQSKDTRAGRSSGGHKRKNTGDGHGFIMNGQQCESSGYDDSKGAATRFFKTFPPEPSLWDTVEEAL